MKKFQSKNFIPGLAITVKEDQKSRVMPVCLAWKDPLPTTDIHVS